MPAGGAFRPTLGVFLVGENPNNGDVAPERRADLRPNHLIPSTRLILLLPGIPLGQNAFERNGIRHPRSHIRRRRTAVTPHSKRAAAQVQFPRDKAAGEPIADNQYVWRF